jgi:hypothetical protein
VGSGAPESIIRTLSDVPDYVGLATPEKECSREVKNKWQIEAAA